MKKILAVAGLMIVTGVCLSHAGEQKPWSQGGPDYLYVKPLRKPKHHGVFDKGMKCLDCHSYDGVDAYTSATMALKKTATRVRQQGMMRVQQKLNPEIRTIPDTDSSIH